MAIFITSASRICSFRIVVSAREHDDSLLLNAALFKTPCLDSASRAVRLGRTDGGPDRGAAGQLEERFFGTERRARAVSGTHAALSGPAFDAGCMAVGRVQRAAAGRTEQRLDSGPVDANVGYQQARVALVQIARSPERLAQFGPIGVFQPGSQAPQSLLLVSDCPCQLVDVRAKQRVALLAQALKQLFQRSGARGGRAARPLCGRLRRAIHGQALRPASCAALASNLSATAPALTW